MSVHQVKQVQTGLVVPKGLRGPRGTEENPDQKESGQPLISMESLENLEPLVLFYINALAL